jgi:hypothetical protein
MNSKYILIVYDSNNPIGGIDDIWGVYDTLEEARKNANLVMGSKNYGDYYQICRLKADNSLKMMESN